ncbi:MAG: hypothetical protein BGO01_02330 [Armatimonadetes bacterium 55-13]|nr:DUF4159 domain-containing protein [Armatimonadota bacterium]OJU65765.1 MAG: hypothetical protein BGO01_02330 [Armatimonadetes bacterium 55-13]
MPIEELIARRISGIEPFNELPIDADVWREAHAQHTTHRFLHAAGSHRPGIVYGLEVFVSPKQERTLVVAPGVGIDQEGRTLLLSEPASFVLEEKGQTYITIAYEDNYDSRSAVTVGGGKKYFRLVEGRQVVATKELPKTPHLELARVDRSGKDKPIKDAKNPFDPAEDELNQLYRVLAFPHCYADGGVGELCFLPTADPGAWKPNRAGLYNMIREANGLGFHLFFDGLFNLRAAGEATDPLLLYVSCEGDFQAINKDQLDGLRRYLENGGTLFAEASKGSDGFVKSFAEIAKGVGATMKPIAKDSPVLRAHHLFASAPPGGADKGTLTGDLEKGILLSTHDYGGAWQGNVPKPDDEGSRDRIRRAVEFGLNVTAFAARRKRRAELTKV